MRDRRLEFVSHFLPRLSRQAEDRQAEKAPLSIQRDPLAQVVCRLGDKSCANAHASALQRPLASRPIWGAQSLMQLQRQYGNRYVQRVLDWVRKANRGIEASADMTVSGHAKGIQTQRALTECEEETCGRLSAKGENQPRRRPSRKFFTPEEVQAEVREEEEEETPQKSTSRSFYGAESRGTGVDALQWGGDLRPHAASATIKCKSGKYVVVLGSWAGTPCGQPDCVRVHELQHIKDWKVRWPKGCKKKDGTNQPDGYLPTGGAFYRLFLNASECKAHIADLKCAKRKLKAASGNCKKTWRKYIKLTKKQKSKYC